MKCEELPLMEYLEDAVSEHDRASVEGHLAGCAGCRAEFGRLGALVEAGAKVGPSSRLGCPSPDALLVAEGEGREPWIASHLEGCEACRHELDALRGVDAGVAAERVPLPARVAAAVGVAGAEPLSELARDVLDLVRARLGEAGAAMQTWRNGVAELVARTREGEAVSGAVFAAPESGPTDTPSTETLEIGIRVGGVELDLRVQGAWVRVRTLRGGDAVRGVCVRVENELGEVVETETDNRGEAVVREDLPGRRRITVEEGG